MGQYERSKEDDEREYKKAKTEAMGKLTATVSVEGASANTGDTAAMNEIADVTKRRETPGITGDAFIEYWRNFKKRSTVSPSHRRPRRLHS